MAISKAVQIAPGTYDNRMSSSRMSRGQRLKVVLHGATPKAVTYHPAGNSDYKIVLTGLVEEGRCIRVFHRSRLQQRTLNMALDELTVSDEFRPYADDYPRTQSKASAAG
jgi:hypothetical protein